MTLLQNEITRLTCPADSETSAENVPVLGDNTKCAAGYVGATKDNTKRVLGNVSKTNQSIEQRQSEVPHDTQSQGDVTLEREHKNKTIGVVSKINAFATAGNKTHQTNNNKSSNGASPRVDVVRQSYQGHKLGLMEWQFLFSQEIDEGKASGIKNLGGVHNVVLLDISESMEEAWPEVTTFFNEYISGLEFWATQGLHDEHVALVTFGHETKVQQRLTDKYRSLKTAFNRLKVGGPSPLTAGMLMTFAAAGSSERQVCFISGIVVPTRVILITDGNPTDTSLYMGPDEATPSKLDEARSEVISEMEQARQYNLDMFIVPVGKANLEFINLIAAVVNGKVISHQDGNQMSKRTLLTLQCGPLGGHMSPSLSLSERDKHDIKEIKENSPFFDKLMKNPSDDDNSYKEKSDSNLPVQGSRVRRGPDWRYGDDQDQGLAGTIVGHCDDGQRVWVDWDSPGSNLFHYRYGLGGAYDVILVDEQRRLGDDEVMAVGCHVNPGLGWKSSNTDVGLQTVGVVLRVHMTGAVPKALVRWENGTRGEYLYMTESHSLPEIQLVSAGTPTSTRQGLKSNFKRTRNKNKN
ncbi:uncharacterized protein LOC128236605 isoform X2 [Mya arenaria]|nr:uncharacterized protein LOC128236605 isoform X2 [Mya arenaria]XP_052807540.1 uncharacterized protein LOC128236605 isoform X2 [Mya arenaria]